MTKLIALLTDFGNTDGYVGILKGVIYNIYPDIKIIDLSNELINYDITSSAWVLKNSYKYFPINTIFLCIVDPGVGSNREKLIVKTDKYYFIAPDNGLLSYIFKESRIEKIIKIDNKEFWLPEISQTFHGRDIFSPVAANLAKCPEQLERFGPFITLESVNIIELPSPIISKEKIKGSIIYIDNFGNLITNIQKSLITSANANVRIKNIDIKGISKSYANKKSGELLAILGSHNNIEIAINGGNAKEFLNASIYDDVLICF